MSDRELGVLLLEPRTCGDEEVMGKDRWDKAYIILELEYKEIYFAKKKKERLDLDLVEEDFEHPINNTQPKNIKLCVCRAPYSMNGLFVVDCGGFHWRYNPQESAVPA